MIALKCKENVSLTGAKTVGAAWHGDGGERGV